MTPIEAMPNYPSILCARPQVAVIVSGGGSLDWWGISSLNIIYRKTLKEAT